MTDIAVIEKLRAALQRHHDWQLAQTYPVDIEGFEIIPADEYCDSGMYDETTAVLRMAEQEITRRTCIETTEK